MASIRYMRLSIKAYTPLFKLLAVLATVYIFLNLWSIEVMNYEIKHQPDTMPDGNVIRKGQGDPEVETDGTNLEWESENGQAGVKSGMWADRREEERLAESDSLIHADDELEDKEKEKEMSPDGKISNSENDDGIDEKVDDALFNIEARRGILEDEDDIREIDMKDDSKAEDDEQLQDDAENPEIDAEHHNKIELTQQHDKTLQNEVGQPENDDVPPENNHEQSEKNSEDLENNAKPLKNSYEQLDKKNGKLGNNVDQPENNDGKHHGNNIDGKLDSKDYRQPGGVALNGSNVDEPSHKDEGADGEGPGHPTAPIPAQLVEDRLDESDDFMAILENYKVKDTYEVDVVRGTYGVDVTFPPFVDHPQPDGPGEGGTGYNFPPGSLSEQEVKRRKEDFNIQFFDEWVSRKISVRRTLMDLRSDICQNAMYNFRWPTISVVVVFYNEAWTTLLRTIYSILERSPEGAITEIVLLDDCSNMDHLKEPLERFIQPMKIVRLIRARERLGLIKARNLGSMYATGEVIIFLDSHVECFPEWLPPLIQPLTEDYKTVTFPVVDGISKDDFRIVNVPGLFVGTLNFKTLTFTWMTRTLDSTSLYYDSPTMPGGLYAISRQWFHHLGAYDPQLKLWGGENVEISLKIWTCGGTLRVATCSHVGHVYRTQSPVAKENAGLANAKNTMRIAEVWLDQYKHLYYERGAYNLVAFGNVKARQKLRRDLQCKSFDWYLDTINPELKEMLDVRGVYAGLVTNRQTGKCLQGGSSHITLAQCAITRPGQIWLLTTKGYLRNLDVAVTNKPPETIVHQPSVNGTKPVFLQDFNPKATTAHHLKWKYDRRKRLARLGTKECLDVDSDNNPILAPCSKSPSQAWDVMRRQKLQELVRDSGRHNDLDWTV